MLFRSDEAAQLHAHPKVGSSWEGFALEQVLRLTASKQAFFWATQGGAELDLLLLRDGKRLGYEFKYSERPQVTRSMRIAIEDLGLDGLTVVCPGDVRTTLAPGIDVVGVESLIAALSARSPRR